MWIHLLTICVQQGGVAAIKVSWHVQFSVHATLKVLAKTSGQCWLVMRKSLTMRNWADSLKHTPLYKDFKDELLLNILNVFDYSI